MVSTASYFIRPPSCRTFCSSPSPWAGSPGSHAISTDDSDTVPIPVLVEPKLQSALLPIRSHVFWFDDGNVVIQVGMVQYRVHISVVMVSTIFAAKLPRFPDRGRSCATRTCFDSEPEMDVIHLDEVTSEEFDVLLGILYPHSLGFNTELPTREWIMVVRTASILGIKALREATLAKIQKHCSPFELVEYGRRYAIIECYTLGLRMLCLRDDALTYEEGEKLGLSIVIEIARAREMLAKGGSCSQIASSHIG